MNIDNLSKFDFFKIEPNKENARILACSSDESKQRPIFILTRVELLDSCIIIHDDDKPAFIYKTNDKETLKEKFAEINQFIIEHRYSPSLFKP